MTNEIKYLILALRGYRQISYGQFDQETHSKLPLTQDAADMIQKLSDENDQLKTELNRIILNIPNRT